MGLILLILLLILVLGAVPAWPYSRRWGYGPSGIFGVLLIILLVMLFFYPTVIPWGWYGPGPVAHP